jgi:hypothetical protein
MTTTSPWVSIFSRFTSEALLFEALIIFSLTALYTGFWLVRKRKFGVIEKQVPAGVVKYYLNELIVDAEILRAQLFGMLTGQGIPATPLANVNFTGVSAAMPAPAASAGTSDAASSQSLVALEAKLAEQAKQIETFTSEKNRIEKELTDAKAATKGAGATGGDPNALAKLQEKIAALEGKLAEYSVIEDDLANLKRLQQENAALKAQLAAKGGAAVATPAPEATPVEAQALVAEIPPADAAMAAVDDLLKDAAPAEAIAAAPEAAATDPLASLAETINTGTVAAAQTPGAPELAQPVAAAEAGTLDGGFEGLVDQVEQSLQSTPEKTAPAVAAAAEAPSTTPPVDATIEKSDADLVSEFEKMLNG